MVRALISGTVLDWSHILLLCLVILLARLRQTSLQLDQNVSATGLIACFLLWHRATEQRLGSARKAKTGGKRSSDAMDR
jgi:hypothetical protein